MTIFSILFHHYFTFKYVTCFENCQDGSEELFPVDENGKIISSDTDIMDAWRVLEDLRAEGLIRHLGVSNFNRAQIDRLLSLARDPPEVIQVLNSPVLVISTITLPYHIILSRYFITSVLRAVHVHINIYFPYYSSTIAYAELPE